MSTRVLNYKDFTGGLNLRADPFQLGENESPDMLNVEVDPRGGFFTRKSFRDWLTVGGSDTWAPRALFAHMKGDATEVLFLVNAQKLWVRPQGGSFVEQTGTFAGAPHGADFGVWKDDVYVAAGTTQPSRRWNGSDGTMTQLATTWSNNYTDPSSNTMPQAQYVAAHSGFLWVAHTSETGGQHRVRFSHPNKPDAWHELDFIDIPEGGGPITGLVPLNDHLLVFFPNAVFAIYGYDEDSFQKVEVTRKVGAPHRQVIARSENGVFFAHYPHGVHFISGDSVDEVSVALRPAIESPGWSPDVTLQWLAWADQRLWWSVPYDEGGVPSAPRTVFTLDPTLNAWTMHRSGCGCGIAPITDSKEAGGPVGIVRSARRVLKMKYDNAGVDVIGGTNYPIPAHFRTRWIDAGFPTIKKRWRRPDFVARETDVDYSIETLVYLDYDESSVRRGRMFVVDGQNEEGLWVADPNWDGTDASLETPPVGAPTWDEVPDPTSSGWGLGARGSRVERGGALGSGVAVQLLVRAAPGQSFGVNAIVFKYMLRKVR